MKEGILKISDKEMLERDNMGLEEWYESQLFSEKKKANLVITVLCHEVPLHIHW